MSAAVPDHTTSAGDTTYCVDADTGKIFVSGTSLGDNANVILHTIWDGGGDTIDFAKITTNMDIDLYAGGAINLNRVGYAHMALTSDGYRVGTIYNALMFEGNTDSRIENATGGFGDDTIMDNNGDDRIWGGNGNVLRASCRLAIWPS